MAEFISDNASLAIIGAVTIGSLAVVAATGIFVLGLFFMSSRQQTANTTFTRDSNGNIENISTTLQ